MSHWRPLLDGEDARCQWALYYMESFNPRVIIEGSTVWLTVNSVLRVEEKPRNGIEYGTDACLLARCKWAVQRSCRFDFALIMRVDRSYTRLISLLSLRGKNVGQNVELIQIEETCLEKQCDENICVTPRYLKFFKFIVS